MKHLDIIIGIVVTAVVYLLTPTIPFDMPEGMKFIVFLAQCLFSAGVGLIATRLFAIKFMDDNNTGKG